MANTKKFKEFIEERYPQSADYMVGYRALDDEEFRIPLGYLNTSIISNRFIRKDIADYADGLITFNSGLNTAGNVYSTIYLQGLNGWFIDTKGNLEVNSIVAREFIETPELRKNRITVMGNQFWFTDSALIRLVTATGSSRYDVYFKLEDGEYGSFVLDDIIKGIFHYDTGFYTVYLRIYEIINDANNGQIGVRVESLNGRAPMAHMLVARMNNFTNTARQGSIFADGLNKYIRVLDGFDPANPTSEGSMETLKVHMGDLSSIKNSVFGDIDGYGLYAENVYLTGRIVVKNDPTAEGQILGVFRGLWSNTISYFVYDQVSYNGSLYSSKQNNNLGYTPRGGDTDPWWELVVAKGAEGTSGAAAAVMEITNDNTTIPTDFYGLNPILVDSTIGMIHTCEAYVHQGTTDISNLYNFTYVVGSPNIVIDTVSAANPYRIGISNLKATDTWESSFITIVATPKDSTSGYATISTVWSISLVRAGTPGESPTAYWIVTDAAVIKKFKNGTFSPNPFIARARAKTGENPIIDFMGYWRLSYGATSVTSTGTTLQFVPLSTVTTYTIELYQDAAMSVLLDKEMINVVEDGTDGVDGVKADWQLYIFYLGTNQPNTPIFTKPPSYYPISGWYDYPNTDGVWWMSVGTVDGPTSNISTWSKPVRMVGIDGENGSYFLNVYQTSPTQPSVPTGSTIPPAGWSLYPTAPTATSYTWLSQVMVYPDGSVGTWSTPIRISGLNGEDGVDGTDVEFIYTRTATETRPSTPGTSQVDDYVPPGWTDDPVGPSATVPYEWTAVRYKIDGVWTSFSTPALWARWSFDGEDGTDGVNGSYVINVYRSSSTQPATPTGTTIPPANWSLTPTAPTDTVFTWMSQTTINSSGTVGSWSTPIRISGLNGENGADGTDVEFVYTRTAVNTRPTTPGTSQVDDYVPAGWTDDPVGPTQALPYEWVAVRYKVDGIWSTYSTPALWSRWSFDGVDGVNGSIVINVYQSAATQPTTPTGQNIPPSGWSFTPTTPTSTTYTWMSQATLSSPDGVNETLSSWSVPIRISGLNGAKGADGTDIEFIYTRTTTFTMPSTPATSQVDDYVPSGWTDDPVGPNGSVPYEWVSVRYKVNGVWSAFSTPALWSRWSFNGEYRVSVYRSSATQPTTPTGTTLPPSGWSLNPTAATSTTFTWMSQAIVDILGNMGTWSTPIRISGENGKDGADGTDIEFIFTRTTTGTAPTTPSNSQVDDYVPSGWTDDPVGPTSTYPYEWVCVRYKVNGVWDNFSAPSLWARWSFDGVDGGTGNSVEMRFAVSASVSVAPTITVTARTPAGWTVQPPTVGSGQFLWMTTATISASNTLVGTWTTPTRVSGETGSDGSNGSDAYSPILSSYSGVLLSEASGAVTGSMASTVLTAKRGAVALTYASGTPGTGQFSVSVVNNSLKYVSTPTVGATTVTYNITDFTSAVIVSGSLTLTVNCENKSTFTIVYYVTRVSNGAPGATGTTGNTIEFRYQANTSSTTAPTISTSSREPANWTVAQPSITSSQYLWLTSATISAANTLVGTWATPTRISGVQGTPGSNGTDGTNGTNGSDAYHASLTSYTGVYRWKNEDYPDGDPTNTPQTTTLTAYRGTTALTRITTSSPGVGQYYASYTTSNIYASLTSSPGTATVFSIVNPIPGTAAMTGTVTITCNCEGKVTFTLVYTGVNIVDGSDGVDANLLDWVKDWDGNSVLVDTVKVVSPRIFTGGYTNGVLTGIALGRNAIKINGVNYTGIYGVNAVQTNAFPLTYGQEISFGIGVDGSAFFGGQVTIANKTYLNKDGSGALAGGNITWGKDGDLTITGNVNATTGTLGTLDMISGGTIYLSTVDNVRYGSIDGSGIHLRFESGIRYPITQGIDWYLGVALYAGRISIATGGILNIYSDFGININGGDSLQPSSTIRIGDKGGGSKIYIGNALGFIDCGSTPVRNIYSVSSLGLVSFLYTTFSIPSNAWTYTFTDYPFVVVTPASTSSSIYRIAGVDNATPTSGTVFRILNVSSMEFRLRNSAPSGASYTSNLRLQNRSDFPIAPYSSIELIYYSGYWYPNGQWSLT